MNALQKAARIKRAERHREQDLLITGKYIDKGGESTRGCSVGCDLIEIKLDQGCRIEEINDTGCHLFVANHDGTEEWIEHLRDRIFEGLPEGKRSWWHVELAKSLPDENQRTERFGSSDWKPYFHEIAIAICHFSLEQKECWQDPYRPLVESAINQVIEYHRNPTKSAESARSAARSARSAAWSAAESARSAARSADRSAAESAAWSAAESAESAWSAAESARSAARSARSAAWSAAESARSAARSAAESARSADRSADRSAARSAAYEEIARRVLSSFSEK